MVPRQTFQGGRELNRAENVAGALECLRILRDHFRCLSHHDGDGAWLLAARNADHMADQVRRKAERAQEGRRLLWLPPGHTG